MSKTPVKDDSSETIVTLQRAIVAHGEELNFIRLRRPTGKDVREIGLPYKLTADESIAMQGDAVAKYVSRLAMIPMSSVDSLDPADFNALGWAVIGFFLASGAKA